MAIALMIVAALTTSAGRAILPVSELPPIAAPQAVAQEPVSRTSAPNAPRTVRVRVSSLRIDNVRIERPSHESPTSPSSVLKFEMFNESSGTLRDPVVRISLVQKRQAAQPSVLPRVLAGPYTIRTNVILDAGYSISYQMVFHNLASDCSCVPDIAVLSVHPSAVTGSDR